IGGQTYAVRSDDIGPLIEELSIEIEDLNPGIDAVDDVHPVSVRIDDDTVNAVAVQSLCDDAELAGPGTRLPECRHELPVLGKPDHPVATRGPEIAIRRKGEELD